MRVIQLPISEMVWPPKNSRKLRWRSARHVCETLLRETVASGSAEAGSDFFPRHPSVFALKLAFLLRFLYRIHRPYDRDAPRGRMAAVVLIPFCLKAKCAGGQAATTRLPIAVNAKENANRKKRNFGR